MRRALANAVLLVTLGMFFAPALTALAAPPVPICCRRGGAHHCVVMADTLGAQGTSLRSNSACPERQSPQLGSSNVALTVSRAAHVELHRQFMIATAVSRRHVAAVHSDHLRGPPSLLD